jgi:hypothetical protein
MKLFLLLITLFFYTSCINIEDEPDTIVYQYIIWNGDTIKCDTINQINYGRDNGTESNQIRH